MFLRMSLACPYSGCGGDSIVERTTDGDENPVYIADERVISASADPGERTAGHEGFECSDCGRPVSLPPGWTFERS
ncbi:hypothetical protein GBF35_25585 [Nonomuraea phyllanthi]|uniref:hypothetical protein n=1 Tax=Nonomuraea phyllanthi TaxID=2219224 RepID=UPI001293AB8C|nr:hypothetical protein [Nonomuraea phyllanthi]QFY09573.1 hypothetical protein GBF35_25585 [Nonomuraea phyllanthi]